jgi:SSS family solute:Na+ symporter
MLMAFLLFVACLLVMVVTTFLFPEPLKDEAKDLVWENWMEPLRIRCGSGLLDYRAISVTITIIFTSVYIAFRRTHQR